MGYKVRKWSDSNARPYDVVYEDLQHNNVHYQPGVEFSTEALAEHHRTSLVIAFTADSVNFIRKHWPIDGAITE